MFPLVTVAGDPYSRGRQYGAATAPLVRHSIASYSRLFAHRRGLDWAQCCTEAQAYLPVLADLAPDLIEEMRGLADGAGLRLDDILALNVRTELLAGVPSGDTHPESAAALQRNRAAGLPEHGECTTVAALPEATASATTLLAQTWDWSGDQRAACMVLRIHAPGQPTALTLTEAGILAKIGLNSAGIAISLDLLRSRNDGERPGMAVHVLLRQMLQATSLGEARQIAEQAPAGASSCITVADASGGAVSLEITPGGVSAVEPTNGLLVHTNHCIDDAAQAGEMPLDPRSTSVERYGRAMELLAEQHGTISVESLQALLRDREGAPDCICRRPDMSLHPVDRGESVAGIVMDVSAAVMYVAPGVPCDVEFVHVPLE